MYTCDLGRMADKITTMSKYGDAGHGGITKIFSFTGSFTGSRRIR